jgi:TonB family protein
MTRDHCGRIAALTLLGLAACGGSPPAADTTPTPEPTGTPAEASAAPPATTEASATSEPPAATGPQPAPQAATVDSSKLGGELTQNEIKAIVEKNGEYFNDCYTLGAGKSQQFVAKVTLKVTLGPTGNVNEAKVQNSTAKNAKVDQCVVDGFKKIKFPAPRAGATGVFTFPMEFKGAMEVQ